MNIVQSATFRKTYKKLHQNQRNSVNTAIKTILADPQIGVCKVGDLSGFYVYKAKVFDQTWLFSYKFDEDTITLLAMGVHENFYRDLRR